MTPTELFNAGRLTDALAAQRLVVATTNSTAERLFLCELLLLSGLLDEAHHQLDAVPAESADLSEYLADFHHLLDAEKHRQSLMIDAIPRFFANPPRHALLRLRAIEALRSDRNRAASRHIEAANDASPLIHGHVDGREFEGLRDGDDRFGSVLELLIGGEYMWVPFEEIRRLRVQQPECMRDRFFLRAQLRMSDGCDHEVYLPVLYAGSHLHGNLALRCGRETDWFSEEEGPVCGVGLRVWTFGDDEELTPWEITQLELPNR